MPRDVSGNYNLPAGSIVATGDTILPSQHNPALTDIATALTQSLARNGNGPMLAPLDMGGFSISIDPNFTMSIVGGNPRITYASGDYLEYDRSANSFNFFIAGGSPIQITPNGIVVGPGNSITRNGGGKYLRATDGAIPGDAWSRGTSGPSGGSDGDFYYQDLTGSGAGTMRVWHKFGGTWKGTA